MIVVKDKNNPNCYCHGVEMAWHKDATRPNGGRWRCMVKRRKYNAKDNATISAYVRKRKYQLYRLKLKIINKLQELDNANKR